MDQRLRCRRPLIPALRPLRALDQPLPHLLARARYLPLGEYLPGNCAVYSADGQEGSGGVSFLCVSRGRGGRFVGRGGVLVGVEEGVA